MCGFVCLWQIDDVDLATRMIGKIAHRGPDDLQVMRLPGVPATMAHCRLAIIGPDDGAQPICGTDDMLVANGEIYNHADLRALLGPARFATRSDSETIVQLFRSGRPGWIAMLDGMFAFVLATPQRVVAARDPLGIKPLYRARRGAGLAFASELKAFDGLGFADVCAIAPGTMFDSLAGTRAWYALPEGEGALGPAADVAAIARTLRVRLEAAVRKWLVADVEVGAFLSGGLDSSLIAALAARALDRPLKTFAVGTAGTRIWRRRARLRRTSAPSTTSACSTRTIWRRSCRAYCIIWRAPTSIWCAARCRPTSRPGWRAATSRRC
jgi:asparagine synthase (glutamine-hydrolysing)